jgi:hypothetical protein
MDITEVIKNQVLKAAINEAEARKLYKKRNLSPSVDFMCMRKSYYDFEFSGNNSTEIDIRDFKYESIRATTVGNNFHSFMEKVCKDAGILRLSETDLIDEEYHIKARLDMVVEIENTLFLVELKSAQEYSLKMMTDENSPDIEHQKQAQLYFHLLEVNKDKPEIKEVLKGRKIRRGIILYENKNKHKLVSFTINKNQKIIDYLLNYAKDLMISVTLGKEPEIDLQPDSFECKYKCRARYYEKCHGISNPTKEEIKDENIWGFNNVKEISANPKFI